MNLQNLQRAISEWNLDGVNEYIREKRNVNLLLPNRMTPLVYALFNLRPLSIGAIDDIILRLIDKGASVNATSRRSRRTATMLAICSHRSEEIVLELINAGMDVNLVDSYNNTVLVLALMYDYGKNVIKTLIDKGTDVNIPPRGDTALIWAFRSGDPDIIEMVLKAGAIINEINRFGEPIYTSYCRYGCKIDEICKFKRVTDFLVSKGIDLKKRYRFGNTIIHLVTCNYIIFLAQRAGISVDQLNNFGVTPLIHSIIINIDNKVNDLLLIGADPNWKNSDRQTILHSDLKQIDKFGSLLIFHGANINALNNFGESPLTAKLKRMERYLLHHQQVFGQNVVRLEAYLSVVKSMMLNYLLYQDASGLVNIIKRLRIFRVVKDQFYRYIDLFLAELQGMQNALLKEDLSIHQFCHEKRYYSSNYIPIKIDQYLITRDTISVNFPNYKDIIFMRLKDNSRKYFKHLLQEMLMYKTVKVASAADGLEVMFDYKCWHHVCKYLNYRPLYALIAASFVD